MKNPHGHAVSILELVREIAGPRADKYCDQLEQLLGAYMDASLDIDEVMGMPFPLSQCERRLFCILHKNLGKLVYHERLLFAVYFDDMDGGNEESMNVHLWKLRQRLEGTKYRIDTDHGVGLKMVPSTEPQLAFFSSGGGLKVGEYATQFRLTPREAGVFEMLYAARGELVPAQRIKDELFPNSTPVRVRSTISDLRDKLANTPFALVNEWGGGYRLVYSPVLSKQRAEHPVDVAAIVERKRQRRLKWNAEMRARVKAAGCKRSLKELKHKPESIAA